MEINQERLDELKAEFAYRHQLSAEEVSRMMNNVIIGFRGMAEYLEPFAKEMARKWMVRERKQIERLETYFQYVYALEVAIDEFEDKRQKIIYDFLRNCATVAQK